MLSDDIIFTEWFNDLVTFIQNFRFTQPPHERGFSSVDKAAVKRPWIYTKQDPTTDEFVWELDDDYAGHIILDDVAYAWDKSCNVYTLTEVSQNYVLTKIFDNTTPAYDFYSQDGNGERVKQKALVLDYLSELQTTAEVATWTVNADSQGNVVLKVTTSTFTNLMVGQFVYFPSGTTTDNFKYQIRQIIQYVSATEVYLSEQWYSDPAAVVDWAVWETIEIYKNVSKNIVFNNIKDADQNVLTYDLNGNTFYMRWLGGKDICKFDGKLWILALPSTSIAGSLSTGEFEIIDVSLVFWVAASNVWERVVLIQPYENYIVVFYNSRISVIWKFAVDENKVPLYNLNEIHSWFSAEGCNQAWLDDDGLYFYSKAKINFFRLDIKADNNSTIKWKPVRQWDKIKYMLSDTQLWYGIRSVDNVNVFWDHESLYILVEKWDTTVMFEYNKEVKWWLLHKFSQTFWEYHTQFYSDILMGCKTYLCLRSWWDDLWEEIKQIITITWPKQWMWTWITVYMVKILLAYYQNQIEFTSEIELGWALYEKQIQWDSDWIWYVDEQNIAASAWALGQVPLWYTVIWFNSLSEAISKIGLIWFKVMKSWVYYSYTMENANNKDLNIYKLSVLYKQDNPATVPATNSI